MLPASQKIRVVAQLAESGGRVTCCGEGQRSLSRTAMCGPNKRLPAARLLEWPAISPPRTWARTSVIVQNKQQLEVPRSISSVFFLSRLQVGVQRPHAVRPTPRPLPRLPTCVPAAPHRASSGGPDSWLWRRPPSLLQPGCCRCPSETSMALCQTSATCSPSTDWTAHRSPAGCPHGDMHSPRST